jgi:hypothetical protein
MMRMVKHVAQALYYIGIVMALPFVFLVGASIMKIVSEGAQSQYINSTFSASLAQPFLMPWALC